MSPKTARASRCRASRRSRWMALSSTRARPRKNSTRRSSKDCWRSRSIRGRVNLLVAPASDLVVRRSAGTVAIEVLARSIGALAWTDLPVWGEALGWLVGSALRIRRAHVEESMERAGIGRRVAAEMFASLGTSAVELLWLAARRRSLAQYTRIDATSSREIERCKLAGRGIVFAASHTGNWDLAACAIAQHIPLMVITKRLSARWVDAFWQSSRAAYDVTLVEAAGSMRRARAHLATGGAVAMMIDQAPSDARHACRAPFLGADVWVDRAPFVLATRSRAPVLVSAAHRQDRAQCLTVIDVLQPPDQAIGRGRAWVPEAAVRATASLDAFVRAHPSEWLWMHRRWKPAAPLAVVPEPG